MLSARLYDAVLRRTERQQLGSWRRELLADVAGDVLEIGAGTGANLPLYGPDVRRLLLLEPDPAMRARLVPRAAGSTAATRVVLAGSASRLPLATASVDAVVSTLALCSIHQLDRALAEIRRVLRPEGALFLIEHVAAPGGTGLWRAQHLLTPVWARAAGGCSLERPTRQLLSEGGFDVATLRDDRLQVPVPLLRPALRGVARPFPTT